MFRVLDWSLRFKLPIWGSLLIVVTTFAVTTSMLFEAYGELEEDLTISSTILGRAIADGVALAIKQRDVDRADEVLAAAVHEPEHEGMLRPEHAIVVGIDQRVIASSSPRVFADGVELASLGNDYRKLAARMTSDSVLESTSFQTESGRVFFLTPVAVDGALVGTLILTGDRSSIGARFYSIVSRGLGVGLLVLAVLVPISWHLGERMTRPLVRLAESMRDVGIKQPADIDPGVYPSNDEVGRLFKAFHRMVGELASKDALEKQMVQAERMAAIGQLAAGVAHEINNPLGGMLMAVDTLKCHAPSDPLTTKTIALIERGLTQIKDTVGALLVEARLNSRSMGPQDVEDVRMLVMPQARKKALRIGWRNMLDAEIGIPSTPVRQIMLNLLLNAIAAANQEGSVDLDVGVADNALKLTISNDGRLLSAERIARLFEPFSSSGDGRGLGLWVTYQIAQQLGGGIRAACEDGRMIFSVELPIGSTAL